MNEDASRAQAKRRTAFALALFAAAVFLSVIIRQWMSNT